MAGEQNTAAVGYEKIYDMGTGLIIAKVQIDKVREQDINARIMKKEMQDQLTANIKNRGQLESLPLLAEKDGVLEIVSGHHRIKSARAAGMKEIIAIIDVSGLSRSKIASKQLAHNAISGFDDPSVLREICKMLDDVDDMLESFIGKDIMEEPLEQYNKLLSPEVHFDFKNITFSFLPHQVKDMDALVKNLESSAPEIIGVAAYEQCKQFVETLASTRSSRHSERRCRHPRNDRERQPADGRCRVQRGRGLDIPDQVVWQQRHPGGVRRNHHQGHQEGRKGRTGHEQKPLAVDRGACHGLLGRK